MLTPSVHYYLKAIGKKGGAARARNLNSATLSSQGQKAVMKRWIRERFKADSFEHLAIPGWQIVDSGLNDLTEGNLNSENALAVAELRPRLRFLGVPVPQIADQIVDARSKLYLQMQNKHGNMAYTRFCAILEKVDSFGHALSLRVKIKKCSSHRSRRWYV